MGDAKPNILPARTMPETALDLSATVTSLVPWVGGAVSNVLGGISTGRRFNRVRNILLELSDQLQEFKSEVSESYVKTEEFEELLRRTLQQAADELNEEKRRIYRDFLIDAIKSPGKPYDEQLRFLRMIENIQPDHIRVLKALSQPPDLQPNASVGSPRATLAKRLPDIPRNHIEELINQLNDMRITNLTSMGITMTAQGAEELTDSITSFGSQFLRFIRE